MGWGQADNVRSRGAALEKSQKQAVSDARKRALRIFGSYLGNCLYNKQHVSDVKRQKMINKRPMQRAIPVTGTKNFNLPSNSRPMATPTKPPMTNTSRPINNRNMGNIPTNNKSMGNIAPPTRSYSVTPPTVQKSHTFPVKTHLVSKPAVNTFNNIPKPAINGFNNIPKPSEGNCVSDALKAYYAAKN